MTMTPAPLNRVLKALEAEPAPAGRLDIDAVVRRGARRRRTRHQVVVGAAVIALGVVGSGMTAAWPSHPAPAPSASSKVDFQVGTGRMPLGSAGAMPRGGYAPLTRSAQSFSLETPVNGALNDLSLVPNLHDSVKAAQGQPARDIISTGDIRLKDKDVDADRREVLAVVAAVRGEVADEENASDKDGGLTSVSLVLRVPSRSYAAAMSRIGAIGTRVSSVNHSDDVTSKVVDTNARLAVQRASVDRIRALLARAESIRDIVSIEGQLSEREATLESLEHQKAALANQISLSTISVRLDKIVPKPKPEVTPGAGSDQRHGFTGGLARGWHSLTRSAVSLAVVVGAVLPWLVVVLVLGWPVLLLTRRARRRWEASIS